MRVSSWSFLAFLSLPVAACGGGGLTLPGPGDPVALTILAGDEQHGPVGEALTDPLVVELVDGDGLPVAGRDVVFRFIDDYPEASVDPGSAATDSAGRAAVYARLGRQEGSQAIEALVAVPGEDLRVRFRLTAMPTGPVEPRAMVAAVGGGGGAGLGVATMAGAGAAAAAPPAVVGQGAAAAPTMAGTATAHGDGNGHGNGNGQGGDGGKGHGKDKD